MSILHWRNKDRYYRLVGSRCRDCGHEHYPPMYTCRKCGSNSIQDKEFPRTGIVETYTVLYETMNGFEDQTPMTIAIIKLTNGVKILSQLVDSPPNSISIGDRVKMVFRKVRENGDSGQIFYAYKFKKVIR